MKERIVQLLVNLKIEYRWVDHPAVFTVAEAAEAIEGKTPIKNLLLQEKGNGHKYLVIMAGGERLDTKALRDQLSSKKLQFASDEVLMETFGVKPGAVSVFGMLHDGAVGVKVVLDKKLLADGSELGFHPNDNTASIFFAGDKLESLLQKLDADYVVADLY